MKDLEDDINKLSSISSYLALLGVPQIPRDDASDISHISFDENNFFMLKLFFQLSLFLFSFMKWPILIQISSPVVYRIGAS